MAPGNSRRSLARAKKIRANLRYNPNMSSLWADTDSDTEAEMLRLLRNASAARRFALADALTNSVVTLSRRALAERRPEQSEREILLEWVGLHYGLEMEQELRDFFTKSDAG